MIARSSLADGSASLDVDEQVTLLPGAGPSSDTQLREFVTWMVEDALPFWTTRRGYGGIPVVEAVDLNGQAFDPGFLRLRVMARQVAVFSSASALGLEWLRPIADAAWSAFVNHFYSPISGWAARIGPYRQVIDLEFTLYDQAFAVFACACRARLGEGVQAIQLAHRTLRRIDELLADKGQSNGWHKAKAARDYDQNSHMHLLEALLALHDVGPSRTTEAMIRRSLEVAEHRLFDPVTNTIAEEFGADWKPLTGPRVEPGHQYEWYWLLDRAARMGFSSNIPRQALLAFAIRHGFADESALIVDALHPDGTISQRTHRLWPHCEAIRAATVHPEPSVGLSLASMVAQRMQSSFLRPANPGTWHDRLGENGECLAAHVPASSLYHLWGAAEALHSAGVVTIPGAQPCS